MLRPKHLRRFCFLLLCGGAHAQEQPPVAAATSSETSEVPQVPGISGLLRGVNGGFTVSSLHDAQTGWATILQPAIGYSFNDIFSVDVTVPVYIYRLAGTRNPNPRPDQYLVARRGKAGDVVFALHAQFIPHGFLDELTFSATAPTGDNFYGLSTGHPTFDLTDRLERTFKYATPNMEIGLGDSSSLVTPLVQRDFTSLGPLAHFQAGFSFALPLGASFSTSAYEQLPLGDQKIYQTVPRRNSPGGVATIVTGRSVAEDNGFTNSLDIPLDRHTTFSAYYNRSLRLRDDVVAIGLTYVFRGTKPPAETPATPAH